MVAAQMAAYDQLIRDPCGGQMAHPPYLGMGGGYLVRQIDVIQPQLTGLAGKVVGGITPQDYNLAWFPGAPTAYFVNGGEPNFTSAWVTQASTGYITNSVVRRFRPVACCLKWLPSGPYNSRQGLVALGYSAGRFFDPAVTTSSNQVIQNSMDLAGNGTRMHEIRWLPTEADQDWTTTADASTSTTFEGGGVFISLSGVDATGSSATTANINGRIEITTVYEWQPSQLGPAQAPMAPPAFTIQQHQSSIGDLGAFLLEGIRRGGSALGQGMVQGATTYGAALLTAGVRSYNRRGAAAPQPMQVEF